MYAIRSLFRTLPRSKPPHPFLAPSSLQQRATFTSQTWTTSRTRLPNGPFINRIRWSTPSPRPHHPHQTRPYGRRPFNYQRFTQTRSFLHRWAARPTFYHELAGLSALSAGFYIINLETVPISGRKRFNIISPATETSQGQQLYAQTLQEYRGQILPPLSREHRLVQRVLNRLLPHSGLEGEKWEIHVIDSPEKNAFVLPGGKVFVFRGILTVAAYDEARVAAVLGHEIAHNVAHHAAERLSRFAIVFPIAFVGSLLVGLDPGIGQFVSKLAFELPASRAQEREADFIGLMMMAEACFDPRAAVGFWERMEAVEDGKGVPEFLSTHPSGRGRMERLREWLPQAEERWVKGECGGLAGYPGAFRREMRGLR